MVAPPRGVSGPGDAAGGHDDDPCVIGEIVRPPAPELARDVAGLFWSAFGPKLSVIPFVPKDPAAAVDLVAATVCLDDVYAALDAEGSVLGVCWVTSHGSNIFCLDMEKLAAKYGATGAQVRTAVAAWARFASPRKGAASLDGFAVRPHCRGAGIGSAMLERVIADAREAGLERLQLTVADTNPKARRLYERFGFGFVGNMWTSPVTHRAGFDRMIKMELML